MMVLDERTTAIQRQTREWARAYSSLALELDDDPDAILGHLDMPIVRILSRMPIPAGYDPDPVVIDGYRFHGTGALERVVFAEEIAVADAGLLLAAPGPVIAGVLVESLGDAAQKQWFYSRMLDHPTWTFSALTEPDHGSDAAAMETRLSPDGAGGYRLTGAKLYIGGAPRAELGVVFARTGPSPLAVTAVLVEAPAPGFGIETIDTIGLRGLRLAALTFEDVAVPSHAVLGRHLKPTQRGMLGAVRALNRLRPGVAAIGVGIARAAYEYVLDHRRRLVAGERHEFGRLAGRIEGTRQLVLRAAAAVDADDAAAGHLASAAKARAAQLAEDSTLEALRYFGSGARLDHPVLDKLARDARGVEFMEGTGDIQKLNLFSGVMRGRLRRARDPHPAR